ncbi:hypothetical protein F0L68_35000 [Solihabitans fulvus]|uniref:Protein arginine N-methyltransferase domain-containing protein n=2 Tax=Solihabitans fulvus TaxID=1892852 RepID=A0A5B2WPH3_9PSEU|nr:hypothetical protein F0L68_35000 [Solihabitans fulvus]
MTQITEMRRGVTAVDEFLRSLSTTVLSRPGHPAPPANPESIYQEALRQVPRWHFSMLNDIERNDAFAVALERRVRPGSHVLDIGSGTGLLAMMAVQAGAGKVTSCEGNPLLAEITRRVIAEHGLSDRVTVIPRMSTDLRVGVDLAEPADLIVSEIVDCGLIGEGILPTIQHARKHLLAPGGTLLPERSTLTAALVDSKVVDGLNRVTSAAGFDVRLFNEVATRGHFPVRLPTWPHRILSEPVDLVSFDFEHDSLDDGSVDLSVPVLADGVAHGAVAWFSMELGGGIVLRNSPDNLGSHWMQAFVPLPEPIPVHRGQSFEFTIEWREERLWATFPQASERAEVTR